MNEFSYIFRYLGIDSEYDARMFDYRVKAHHYLGTRYVNLEEYFSKVYNHITLFNYI